MYICTNNFMPSTCVRCSSKVDLDHWACDVDGVGKDCELHSEGAGQCYVDDYGWIRGTVEMDNSSWGLKSPCPVFYGIKDMILAGSLLGTSCRFDCWFLLSRCKCLKQFPYVRFSR